MKEFLFAFSPKDKNYREVLLSRDSYSAGTKFSRLETFTPETVRDTMGLIKAMVDAEAQLERVRENLRLRRNFNYKDAYRSLDREDKGAVTLEDIRDFLTGRYLFCTDVEIAYLVERMDKTKSGGISLNEFIKEMRPKLV